MDYIDVTHPSGSKVIIDISDISRIDLFVTKESQYTKIEFKSWGIVVCNETPDEINEMILKIGRRLSDEKEL